MLGGKISLPTIRSRCTSSTTDFGAIAEQQSGGRLKGHPLCRLLNRVSVAPWELERGQVSEAVSLETTDEVEGEIRAGPAYPHTPPWQRLSWIRQRSTSA